MQLPLRKRPFLKDCAVRLSRSVAPKLTDHLLRVRSHRHDAKVEQKLGLARVQSHFVEHYGLVVQSGPFAGMQYIGEATGSVATPKLVGAYELELHSAIEAAIARDPRIIIDIGSAEGYYAVGFARRLPRSLVYAFDIDARARRLCTMMIRANGVEERVSVHERCDPQELSQKLTSESLVISDCEGYEAELLDPSLVPTLKAAHMIVELHENARPGVTHLLFDRFSDSHNITTVAARARVIDEHPILNVLPTEERVLAINEVRMSPQQWVILTPKS